MTEGSKTVKRKENGNNHRTHNTIPGNSTWRSHRTDDARWHNRKDKQCNAWLCIGRDGGRKLLVTVATRT